MKDDSRSPRAIAVAAAILLAAVALAWCRSLGAPFVLDDHDAILSNASLRSAHVADWLFPNATRGETIAGRPLLNLSFVFNYALGGVDPRGYRLVNVLLHAGSALLLFGLVRRTAERLQAARATLTALAVALIWAVHPLQTAAVTYVAQRAESLAGFWFLLTLYAFVRGSGGEPSRNRARWLAVSAAAAVCGVATKETAAMAPLLVLLWDRTLVAGSFAAAWRARRGYYIALAASWLLFAGLVVASGGRGGSAGFDAAIGVATYFFTQCEAVVRYLGLAFWPRGQVFDYGVPTVASPADVAPQFLLLVALGSAAVWLLAKNRVPGLLGAAFFLLLAPSSSFVPVATQTMAEHRMYLALAPLVAGGVLAAGRIRFFSGRGGGAVLVTVAALLIFTTSRRNELYRSEITLWQDTVAGRPANPRAHYNLGLALLREGRGDEALVAFRAAARLQPNHAFAHFQMGTQLLERREWAEASRHLRLALEADPDLGDARVNLAAAQLALGNEAARAGNREEAARAYREAIAIGPSAEAQFAWGNLLAKSRRFDEALAAYRAALAIDPEHGPARNNLANALFVTGRFEEAIREYEDVLKRQPENAAVRENLQRVRELQRAGR